MSEVVDLRSAGRVLRRHLRVLGGVAGAGLLLGAVYGIAVPPKYSSTSLVLLPPAQVNSSGKSTRNIDTQVRIALSDPVLEAAGATVPGHLSAKRVAALVSVKASTDDILQIKATAPGAQQAEQVAESLANSFVGFSVQAKQDTAAPLLPDLQARAAALTKQVDDLQAEIQRTSARLPGEPGNSEQGARDSGLLGTLRSEQSSVSRQLDDVTTQISNLKRGSTDAATNSDANGQGNSGSATAEQIGSDSPPQVLQHAIPATRPGPLTHDLTRGLLGALLATALAAVAILVINRRDRRIRSRDDIASALGTPVWGSLRGQVHRTASGWSSLIRGYDPPEVESWALRKIVRNLGRLGATEGSGVTVAVLALDGDHAGLAVGTQIASFTAGLAVSTRLVPWTHETSAAPLWAAFCAFAKDDEEPRPGLRVGSAATAATGNGQGWSAPADGTALTVVLAVLDRQKPDLSEVPVTDLTLVSLASGTATAEELARLAVAAEDQGRVIDGVVVANPLTDDETTGLFPRFDRSNTATIPTRLTGMTTGGRR